MPRAVSMVRQATSAASTFVGAVAQLIVDQGLNVIRVHDNVTPGGFPQLGANNNLSDLSNKALARTNLSVYSTAQALAAANNLSDLVSASNARVNLGLGTAAVLNSTAVCLTANNLSDLTNAGTARTSLGLGNAALGTLTLVGHNVVTVTSATTGNLSNFSDGFGTIGDSGLASTDILTKSGNFSGLANIATARANLALGSAAVKSTSDPGNTFVAAVAGAPTVGHVASFQDVNGTVTDSGIATSNIALYSDNLSSLSNKATARSNLLIKTFISGYSTSFGANAVFTATHGLGAIAGKCVTVDCYLQCTIAEGGYSVGDQYKVDGNGSSTHAEGGGLWIDGTNVGYVLGGNGLLIRNKAGGNAFGINVSNWQAYICVTVIG